MYVYYNLAKKSYKDIAQTVSNCLFRGSECLDIIQIIILEREKGCNKLKKKTCSLIQKEIKRFVELFQNCISFEFECFPKQKQSVNQVKY